MNERDFIRERAARIAGYVACWTDERTSHGDFDGRDWALEFFDVPVNEQRRALERLWDLRKLVRKSLGRSLILIFHRPEETERLYPWARAMRRPDALDDANLLLPRVPAIEPISRPELERYPRTRRHRTA